MKVNFSLSYFIAFFSLVFLIQELHDWAHVLAANWICGCFGTKGFDDWTFCDHCEVSGNILSVVWLAGPIITYILVWVAWSMMSRSQNQNTRSFGFSLLFAANPFANLFAAFGGGGDITLSLRMMLQNPDNSNHIFVALLSLMLVLFLTVPPIFRSLSLLKGRPEKWIIIAGFLIIPNLVKLLVVDNTLNYLLKSGFFDEEVFLGAPLLVLIWFFSVTIMVMINHNSLLNFIRKKEKRTTLRV
jgi:hypothetical protein